MSLVNIPRNRDDPNYRYKMPRMLSKIEGRGNGIKTNISNLGDIAKSLKRPPMYVTKFFGCELGAMAKFEDAEEKAIINGAHNDKDLTLILDKFIEMYVLCMGCHLPEIDMNVKKGVLNYKCNACGSIGLLDCTHKAATYMIRNPPDNNISTLGKKKKSKEERREEKIKKQQQQAQAAESEEQVENEKEKDLTKKKKEKKKKCEEKDKKKKKSKEKEQQSTDEDSLNQSDEVNENTPSSLNSSDEKNKEKEAEEKIKSKSKNSKSSCSDQLLLHEKLKYDSDELVEVINRMRIFFNSNKNVSVEEFFREIRLLQVSQDFDAKCRMYVTLCCLFNDGITVADLEAKLLYLCRIFDSSTTAFDVLNSFEHFCYVKAPKSLPIFPYLVQKLYGAEILDSEDILKYYNQEKISSSSFNACKKSIQPFLAWLRENESEEESSDGECEAVKNITVRTKSLNLNQNNNGQSSDNFTSATTTPNTTKEGDFEEEEFHDAVEELDENEIIDTSKKYQNGILTDDDDFDIDAI